MILALAAKGKKTIACTMLALMYVEMVLPSFAFSAVRTAPLRLEKKVVNTIKPVHIAAPAKREAAKEESASRGGPTQPESQAFTPVGDDQMVDLFSGNFSYNIPLVDVGGYPIALGYNSGITMDDEASWVGLGWNINPGSIIRNMRGLPDDFNGTDSVAKEISVKENKTIGGNVGITVEIGGSAINKAAPSSAGSVGIGGSIGMLHNTYRGWGIESGVNASIKGGSKASGTFTGGLTLNNSSQEGLTITPSLSYKLETADMQEKGGYGGVLTTSLSYNTRAGLKTMQFSGGVNIAKRQKSKDKEGKDVNPMTKATASSMPGGPALSFAYPGFTPTINVPYTSLTVTVNSQVGTIKKIVHPSLQVTGYISKQWIADEDKRLVLPAYGYLNYQNGASNPISLLDFNRDKENVYREKFPLPNIAVPNYTYDIFSISGQGIGGSFRAYRSDIGYVFDHRMKTKDASLNYSGDIGVGDIVHGGTDLNYTRAFTESGAWLTSNPLASKIGFTKSSGSYEAVYFKNPSEKTVNDDPFYETIGMEDVVVPQLYQKGNNTQDIHTTNILRRFKGNGYTGEVDLSSMPVKKVNRDKRSQVITYLTAEEAGVTGVSPYIENYALNKFIVQNCATPAPTIEDGYLNGLRGDYFKDEWNTKAFTRIDSNITFRNRSSFQNTVPNSPGLPDNFHVRWTGRVRPDVTGTYRIRFIYDDGIRLFVNDSIFHNDWRGHDDKVDSVKLNLEAGQLYNIRLEYFNGVGKARLEWLWTSGTDTLGPKNFFQPAAVIDSFIVVKDVLYKEKRITSVRKANHISEISVLNPEGQRYVYGIPVYNFRQKEATFAVDRNKGNVEEGRVDYTASDASTRNMNGVDRYYSSEEMPAYAHSYLLTGILSSDYVDMTSNGITDDDPGNAVKFNYTKTAGKLNPYKWRTPYSKGANYNEGLKSDTRDDKGSLVYGEKELWYLNSIESKNFIATFTLERRHDLQQIDSSGKKLIGGNTAMRLKEINLYTKADFIKRNVKARPVKTVHFDYTYELCKGYNDSTSVTGDSTGKLTLKKVWFSYNGNKKARKNAYVFHYNSNNPRYDHKSFDRWGNYKNAADNPNATSSNKILNSEYPYVVQDSSLAAKYAGAWALDSIILPSGGRIKVTYESDDYGYVQNKRAAQMFSLAGFSLRKPEKAEDLDQNMYNEADAGDKLYVGVNIPEAVSSREELYNKYFYGLDTMIYIRLNVKMPADKWGRGNEYVSCYARLVKDEYGFLPGGKTIWFNVRGMNSKGGAGWDYSPMAKAAAQFLRLNLPSKAYPGSDVGDNMDLVDGLKMLTGMADNIHSALTSYDKTVRQKGWVREVDLTRSQVRLASPEYKKYGGGHRVKRIVIYDHWNAMTGKKESMYGTEYEYTTVKNINGKNKMISSGVATFEPVMGGEENPLRVPIEYSEQSSTWAPVNMGYIETPITESFFPAPSVGYSVVRTRSIKKKNTRSANGFTESHFYTAYDFPTITEYSLLNNDTKKRFKPALANLLRINSRHHLVISQGFKVELNNMHGQVKATMNYAETDSIGAPSSYSVNYYHVEDQNAEFKRLDNRALIMDGSSGAIYKAHVGEDIELMTDMRQQRFLSNNISVAVNGELFTFGVPPVMGYVAVIIMPQREENLFRSAAIMKVINRHGLLDSMVVVDKGSKVVTRNLLLDGETGEVILTATQNEFEDSVFQFSYPAGWMYDGMSGAYKNVGATMEHVNIQNGRITNFYASQYESLFTAGDKVLRHARNSINPDGCSTTDLATFSNVGNIWVVDANVLKENATPALFFVNEDGSPYSGNDVTLKVVRSGRRNIGATAGSVIMMKNPVVNDGENYRFIMDKTRNIINANVVEYKQNWQVDDKMKQKKVCAY